MRGKVLLVVGSMLMAANAFAAEKLYSFQVGNWSGGAYKDEGSARFSHCSVVGTYRSGIVLALGIDRDYSFLMILGHDSWVLAEGDEYFIDIYIDARYIGNFIGTGQDSIFLTVNFGDNKTIYDRIRYGNVMKVVAARDTFEFSLAGTARALQRVKECVDTAVALAPEGNNPFSREATNPFSYRQEARGTDESYQETVRLILAAAGIHSPRFLTSTEARDIPGFILAWVANGVYGIVLSAEGNRYSADATMATIVGELGSDCSGHYMSGYNPAEAVGLYVIKEGFGTCATGAKRQITYVTGLFSETDVVYFVQYSEDNDSKTAEEYHASLRDVLKLIAQDLADAG